ncbi:MAG: serine acetyltransferase [Clostridia bacterium]|nr:serine acetyltransferase [Clostridia bacterium]
MKNILDSLNALDESERTYFTKHTVMVPSRPEVVRIVKKLQSLMFPTYFSLPEDKGKQISELSYELLVLLKRQLTAAYSFSDISSLVDTEELAYEILERIPAVKEMLIKDITAIYEGDPAARSPEEIILSYPGFYAISIYRIAHEFYLRGVPYISRIMTEFAHEKTGIDIHAGAMIGEYFFIDHGTGIVIGETTTIGNRVKLYQGVTLGAKSFELDDDGNPIKGIKRHPDIGNDCVVYANATILGGNTKIGDGCTIGGNVWLTHSVPAGETVYYQK